ncbi:MAG: nucleotidyltransferase domain-containing protein [FCB group bacterium]|jgi:predicted nucleotidyltransferase
MIDSNKITEIVNKIQSNFELESIILFGSYANGTANKDSDLDLLIIKETDLPSHHRSFEIYKLLIGSMIPMDILVYTKKEFEEEKNQKFSFLYSALKNSKVLYERN